MEKLKQLCDGLNQKVRAQWEIITPDIAAELLRHRNKYNRSLKKRTVDAYARDMQNGKWRETGEPIIIDSTGMVANGHHRLQAILKSGSTIITLIVRGVEPEAIRDMDQQAKRTAADVFTMDKIENAAVLSAVVKAVLEYRATQIAMISGSGSKKYVATTSEIRDEFLAHKDNYIWAGHLCQKVNTTNKLIAPRIIGMLAYTLLVDKHHSKEKIEDFLYQFADQRDFCIKVIRDLRQKLINDAMSGQDAKLTGPAKRYYLFKTWNSFITGKEQVLQGFNKDSKVELI